LGALCVRTERVLSARIRLKSDSSVDLANRHFTLAFRHFRDLLAPPDTVNDPQAIGFD